MRKEVVWRPVIFASFVSASFLRIAEEIVMFCLVLFLVLFGYEETLAHTYNEVYGLTLIPSQMVMAWKLL